MFGIFHLSIMPRKKKEGKLVRYFMPAGTRETIDTIVDGSSFYINKPVWKQKFYYIAEYVASQNINAKLDVSSDYVNIHEETTAKIIGVNNQRIATMLRQCISSGLFKKDSIVICATVAKLAGKDVYVTEGKSCGYQFVTWNSLEEVTVSESRGHYDKAFAKAKALMLAYDKKLKQYQDVLNSIRLKEENPANVILELLQAKQKKKSQKENYDRFIREFKSNRYPNKNKYIHIPLVGNFVPPSNEANLLAVTSYLECYTGGNFVPNSTLRAVLSYPADFKDGNFVPDETRKAIEVSQDEILEAINRYRRSVYKINGGYIISSRPNRKSRVYNEITSLKRELRKLVLLDGKNIIGMDIANCQPLIAYLLIEDYWFKKIKARSEPGNPDGNLPVDVLKYKADCEAGEFYNNFMNELQVPKELRSQFKADFFAKVFFSEHNGWKDLLKDLFIERYPSCWEAICELKGGLNSKNYKKFSVSLQEREAQIIFDTVNMELLNSGIKAFNIFDAIYVNNMEAYEKARQLTINAFKLHGLTPKIEPEIHQEKEQPKEEMNKKYTVEELLPTKARIEDVETVNKQPSKLQHLKTGEKRGRMNELDRIAQGIKEQDAEEERILNSIPQNEKEIHEFVVLHLQKIGEKASVENVNYFTKVVKDELKLKDTIIDEPAPSGYRYVNPYVKRSA